MVEGEADTLPRRPARRRFDLQQAVEMRKAGASIQKIGKALGIDPTRVRNELTAVIDLKEYRAQKPIDLEKALEMRRAGATLARIVKAVGVPFRRLTRELKNAMG